MDGFECTEDRSVLSVERAMMAARLVLARQVLPSLYQSIRGSSV